MLDKQLFQQQLAALPVFQYVFCRTEELVFSERVREICKSQCPMYHKSWSCPPAVGTFSECKEKCLSYPEALILTTAAEVNDPADMSQTLVTRAGHEKTVRQAAELLKAQNQQVFVLSAEACTRCERCTWPDGPCRQADRMTPCIESHGILATDLAEKCQLPFLNERMVVWYAVLFYKD